MRRNISKIAAATLSMLGIWALSTAVQAETIVQTSSEATNVGLYGGQPTDIAVDGNGDAVYLATFSPSGIFYSQDDGDTWEGLPTSTNYGIGKQVEVDQSTGDVYAMIGDNILHSDDEGDTWTVVFNESEILGRNMVYAHDILMASNATGGVFVTTDDGATYTEYTIDSSGTAITHLVAAEDEEVFYAVVEIGTDSEKLYSSSDGGQNWTDMDVASNGVGSSGRFYHVAVDPTDSDHIVLASDIVNTGPYQSTDGGSTWALMLDGGDHITGNTVHIDADGRLYIGTSYTDNPTDGTPTWSNTSVTTPLSTIFGDFVMSDPSNTDLLFMDSGMSVAKSTNRGTSWTDETDELTAVRIFDIDQSDDKDVVWIGANGGLAMTENFTDSEADWTYPVVPQTGAGDMYAVWIDPDNSDWVVAGGQSEILSYSEDGGTTWTAATVPDYDGDVRDIKADPDDDTILYAIIWNDDLANDDTGAVLMSEDSGETWTDLEVTDDAPVRSLEVTENGVYAGVGGDATTNTLYMYDGSTWTAITGDFTADDILAIESDPDDAETMYMISDSFYISEDAGDTWTESVSGMSTVQSLRSMTLQTSTTPTTIYVSGQKTGTLNGVIYKSSNGGATWSKYYTGLKQENFYAMLFDGLIAGNDRGAYDIKTKGQVGIKVRKLADKPGKRRVTVTLKDKVTKKKLKNKVVKIYKKRNANASWRKVGQKQTGNKGKVNFTKKLKKNNRIKIVWKRTGDDLEEYTATRRNKRITKR